MPLVTKGRRFPSTIYSLGVSLCWLLLLRRYENLVEGRAYASPDYEVCEVHVHLKVCSPNGNMQA